MDFPQQIGIGKIKVIEVMIGCGALAKTLIDNGIDIVPTDNMSCQSEWQQVWCDIEKMDCLDAIQKYKDRDLLIMSWSPLDSDSDYKCLLKIREVNSNMQLLVIGEFKGCTGSNRFWSNTAKYLMTNKIEMINSNYKTGLFIRDKIYLVK